MSELLILLDSMLLNCNRCQLFGCVVATQVRVIPFLIMNKKNISESFFSLLVVYLYVNVLIKHIDINASDIQRTRNSFLFCDSLSLNKLHLIKNIKVIRFFLCRHFSVLITQMP